MGAEEQGGAGRTGWPEARGWTVCPTVCAGSFSWPSLCIFSFIPTAVPGTTCHPPQHMDEETEPRRGRVTCLKSHSRRVVTPAPLVPDADVVHAPGCSEHTITDLSAPVSFLDTQTQ